MKAALRQAGSLRLRLLVATLVSGLLALAGAHVWLGGQFRQQVLRQFDAGLAAQLDQLAARLQFDADGRPRLDPRGLSDPRWERPLSGLYWQVEPLAAAPGSPRVLLRSRSLWDAELPLPADTLADGEPHRHDATGPRGERLRVLEQALRPPGDTAQRWRLSVAADLGETRAAMDRFDGVLAAALTGLGLLLALAALAQVAVALAPLRRMQQGLQRVRDGRQARLDGRFPAELQPLIDGFNGVLDRNAEVVERARAQAGNLAHGLKTPLALMAQAAHQAAQQAGPSPLATLVTEQVQLAERQMHSHLARARAAATQRLPGQRTELAPLVQGLLHTLDKLHADRHLDLSADGVPPGLAFAGEAQDLQEMLGNLVDNACRNARTQVAVSARRAGEALWLTVDDDGPGIAPALRASVLQRGVRLDERPGGSGLGLAIVLDLARLYGGDLQLEAAELGGLRAVLRLPASPPAPT